MNKNKIKNNEGITLIALVITIIVLIVLASVSISLVLGERGIVKMAREGRDNYLIAANEEQVASGQLEEQWDSLINGGNTPPPGGDDDYSYDNPYIPTNFTHTTGEWNSGFTIKGNAGSDNADDEFVWVPCVLDQEKVKPGDTVQTFGKHFSNLTAQTDPSRHNAEHAAYWGTDEASMFSDEGNSATSIRESVGTYGGFYIAKYQASQDNETAKSVSESSVWNNITRTNAIIKAERMIPTSTGCKSALVSGECWDTTMQWMVKSSTNAGNETGKNGNYDVDSSGKGYYSQSSATNTGYYAVNGIYDMAGNVFEWTTENCTDGDTYPVYRGGVYYLSGSAAPAACRGYDYDAEHSYVGFRVVLYK